MQETRPQDMTTEEARRFGRLRQEFFTAENHESLNRQMDERLEQLPNERLVRRVKVGRNDPCPCGSGRKFKKCCITGLRSR